MADNTIAKAYVQIEPTTQGIKGKLAETLGGEVESAGKSIGGKFGTAIGTAAKVGAAGVVAATGAITAFGKASVDAGKSFDSSMSQVAATMGYSVAEINQSGTEANKTFTELSNFAQQMGASTAFSASEAADALNYMALAGYDSATSMEVLPSVLDLAAAGGIGLADASDMVTDALSAMGKDSSYASTMVDQMAKASSKSNTSVQQLGEAMLTIGATGRQAAGGTKELATMLGVMADNGIKGTEGGTHLRNIMLSLAQHSDKIKDLGVDVYDANGNLRDMTQIFTEMGVAMKDMTEEEKTQFLTKEMFNKTDLATVNALLGTQASRYKELGDAISSSQGAASDMANTQLDNLEGDITLFKSALEGVQIQVSSMLTPSIREFVQMTSEGLGSIATSLQSGDIEGAFGQIGEYLGELLNKIIEKLPEMMNAAEQLLSAFGEAILTNLPMLVSTALELIGSFANYILEALPQIIDAGLQIIVMLGQGIVEALPDLMSKGVEIVLAIVDTVLNNLDQFITLALDIIVALAEGIVEALPALMDKAPVIIERLVEAIIANLPKLIACAIQLIIALADGLIQAIPRLLLATPKLIAAIVSGLINGIKDIIAVGGDLVDGLWNGIKNSWSNLVNNVKSLASNLVSSIKSYFEIGSPSKLLRDEVGQWIPEGVAVGIEATADSPIEALNAMGADMTTTLQSQIAGDMSLTPMYSSADVVADTNNTDMLNMMRELIGQMSSLTVNVSLEGDAAGLFNAVRKQDSIYTKANGRSAFA